VLVVQDPATAKLASDSFPEGCDWWEGTAHA
jgi:hypothetical protein